MAEGKHYRRGGGVGMRGAAALQFASKYANVAVQLVVTAVLARLISPADFGLLSIVTVFTSFFQLFSDMGIGVAIVQYSDLSEGDYGGLFGFSAVLAAALAALFCTASVPVSKFYGDARLVPLCCAASPALVFSTLNMVPNGLMLKGRRFGAIAVRLVASTALSGVVAVLLALTGAECYALIAQTVLSAFIVLVWNLASRPIRGVSLHFMKPLRRVFSYSAYQFGFSFINYFSRNLDNLVIGRVLGTEPLGYYDKAYKLTTYPMSNVSSVVASVIQPYMAESQDDKGKMLACWFKVTKLLSLVGAAVAAVFVAAAPEVVEVFYGPQWAEAAPLFQALSASVYFQMLGNPSGAFFQSLGRTDLMFRQGLVNTALTVSGLVIGCAIRSLQAVAVCVSAAFCVQMVPIAYYLIVRGMGASPRILAKFLPELLTAAAAVVACLALAPLMPAGALPLLTCKLAVVAAVMVAGYALTGQLRNLRSLIGS